MSPRVSVLVPCLDEERHIIRCLESIVENRYPSDRLEVLVIDGGSRDRTRELVAEFSKSHACVRLIDNPSGKIPTALNLGIAASSGKFVFRLDAHSAFSSGYIARCLELLSEHGADRVGGMIVTEPRDPTPMGRAIARALSLPFGVGNSGFRTANGVPSPRWTDTVPFWGCRKAILAAAGPYNEKLLRTEDMEYSIRLKELRFKTLLAPELACVYYARSTLGSFWEHSVRNGIWAVLPFRYSRFIPIRPRHLAPLAFMLCLSGAGTLAAAGAAYWPLLACAAPYLALTLGLSVAAAIQERDAGLALRMPLAFAALHFGYGLGSLIGLLRLVYDPCEESPC